MQCVWLSMPRMALMVHFSALQVMRLREDNAALMETLVRTKVELAETQGALPSPVHACPWLHSNADLASQQACTKSLLGLGVPACCRSNACVLFLQDKFKIFGHGLPIAWLRIVSAQELTPCCCACR